MYGFSLSEDLYPKLRHPSKIKKTLKVYKLSFYWGQSWVSNSVLKRGSKIICINACYLYISSTYVLFK